MNKKIIILILLLILFSSRSALAITCNINGTRIPCSEMPTWFGVVWTLVALYCVVIGILLLFRPFAEWSIRFTNKLRGVPTEITPAAITYRRIMGIFSIIFGIIFLIIRFNF